MSALICQHCQSSNVQSRGTREKDGETYVRLHCQACSKWSRSRIEYDNVPTFEKSEEEVAEILEADTFIVTSAQNNTPLDLDVWRALNRYANHKNAEILVVPLLYLNPTAPGALQSEDAWWPPEVMPYLVQNDIQITPGLRVVGDAGINATARNPLTGFEASGGSDSAIYGHGQVQMKTVATPQKRLPKILLTTGSVSENNYSRSKVGKKARDNHSMGGVIVESSKGKFHLRSLIADESKEFRDIDLCISSKSIKKVRVEAIVLGDEHVGSLDPNVKAATFTNKDSIVNTCKPKMIIRHDIIDGYSISHHHQKSASKKYSKFLTGKNSLKAELDETARHLEETTPKGCKSVVVASNHHDHIRRWLEEVEWRSEPHNAVIYHELWTAWLEAIGNDEGFDAFTWWLSKNCTADLRYLTTAPDLQVMGIFVGYHGDKGINGAKGSLASFAKIGVRTITGHTHSPGIEKGATAVGTGSLLELEYTQGPSSWMHSHCLIHGNGETQLIFIIDGDWRP
tara:strand:+ start:2329 stop:3864 length:1536 start_codon:yes stop_codon:yes gene_type:complete